ncbi:transcriptional regulator domain-containing protein [Nguyenibacter vanlangensis]|uniref:transcriptional regulator domain-containing protein n=1 Tax=Nguyenibacter vanlangensis TaxID=1216886 RepID=UPI001FE2F70A|nr:DUF6499 domain-containing protein [Nguyenibacter vanlangensis]
MPRESWRSPETTERLNVLDRPGFAAEFLRRNPEYRRDFAKTQREIARKTIDAETGCARLAARWRLRFRP